MQHTMQQQIQGASQTVTLDLDPALAWIAARLSARPELELLVVGGPVRDALMGRPARDPDAMLRCTHPGLSPQGAVELLRTLLQGARVEVTGRDFPVVTVSLSQNGVRVGEDVQIAFPRTERSTGPGERDFVFDCRLDMPTEEDLGRRDLTINGMAARVSPGQCVPLIDPFGGEADLRAGLVRAIGDPAERLAESPVRTLRAVRFAARYGFALDRRLRRALTRAAPLLSHIEREALGKELLKHAESGDDGQGSLALSLRLLSKTGLLEHLVPEWAQARDLDQRNPHHSETVGDHILSVVGLLDQNPGSPALRWAGFFHDLAKPETMTVRAGRGHFYGHEERGAELARRVLGQQGWRLGSDFTESVAGLVALHMDPGQARSPRAARRLAVRAGTLFEDLLALHQADRRAHVGEDESALQAHLQFLREAAASLPAVNFCDHDLALRGQDIAPLVDRPQRIGEIKRALFSMVVDGLISNEREPLLEQARSLAQQPVQPPVQSLA